MPQFDGTGPMGQGAITGRGMGKCQGARNFAGCPKGRGRGRGYFAPQVFSPADQITALDNEEKYLLQELEAIKAEKEALKEKK